MIKRKIKKQVFEFETVVEIVCDICKAKLLKDRSEDEMVTFATLVLTTEKCSNIVDGDISEECTKEVSDICKNCYKDILRYIYSKGGKVPSFFQGANFTEKLTEAEEAYEKSQ